MVGESPLAIGADCNSARHPGTTGIEAIVALADVYDALTSRRAYKDAMSHEEARRIIVDGSGSHFDPEIVQAFLGWQERFRALMPAPEDCEESDVHKAARLAIANV